MAKLKTVNLEDLFPLFPTHANCENKLKDPGNYAELKQADVLLEEVKMIRKSSRGGMMAAADVGEVQMDFFLEKKDDLGNVLRRLNYFLLLLPLNIKRDLVWKGGGGDDGKILWYP